MPILCSTSTFRFSLLTKELAQQTDGPHDDFDPHELSSGRIVFTSTRRGGVGRCILTPQSLTYTLHSMEPDGSDLNSNEIGWIGNDRRQISAQKKGAALWPPVDVDPTNVTGVEKDFPVNARAYEPTPEKRTRP